MKLLKKLRFRHIRVEKLTRLQIISRICAVGAVLCLIGAALCYTFFEKDYKSSVKSDELIFPYIEHVSVITENVPVYIYPSTDENIKVKYLSDSEVTVKEEKGRLTIKQEGDFIFSLFSLSQLDYKIEVFLPEKTFRSIILATSDAPLYSCPLNSSVVNITTKSGYVQIEDIKCQGRLTVETDSGTAQINVSEFSGGELKNRTGNIDITFTEDIETCVLSGSRCYINGLAVQGGSDEPGLHKLKVTTNSGKVRIFTGKI